MMTGAPNATSTTAAATGTGAGAGASRSQGCGAGPLGRRDGAVGRVVPDCGAHCGSVI